MKFTKISLLEMLNTRKWQLLRLFCCFLCCALCFILLGHCDNIANDSFFGLAVLSCFVCIAAWGIKFRWLRGTLFWFVPLINFFILEGFIHNPLMEMQLYTMLFNILLYYLMFVFLLFVTKNNGVTVIITSGLAYVIGLANYLVIVFRQNPILPWDLLSTGTALKVVNNYSLPLTGSFVFLTVWYLLVLFFGISILHSKKSFTKPIRFIGASVVSILMVCWILVVQSTFFSNYFIVSDILAVPFTYYRINGYAVGFARALNHADVEKPTGYSSTESQNILTDYTNINNIGVEQYPNIIVVMNEAFSDLSVLGNFHTNEDYLPYWSSISENTIRGELHVSIKGGNTANTEFEFLTGNSMAFLPTGSSPYTQFVKNKTPSLASYLKNTHGYTTYAIHPFLKNAWRRNEIYPLLGFDNLTFIDGFSRDTNKIREYISDAAVFDKVIELYNNRKVNERFFSFCVTMQNHGGYDIVYDNFQSTVTVDGLEDNITLNQYLSLIKETDKAFKEFVEYFSNVQEPTIILMFGDHQPADAAIQGLLDKVHLDTTDLEQFEKQYITEFVLWANYDIEEKTIDYISPNYLSSVLLDVAGIPLSSYQNYLLELQKDYPVITANCVIDKTGNYYRPNVFLNNKDLINYNHLQYYMMFDCK